MVQHAGEFTLKTIKTYKKSGSGNLRILGIFQDEKSVLKMARIGSEIFILKNDQQITLRSITPDDAEVFLKHSFHLGKFHVFN